ncbi:hypothetical protein IST4119_05201 [Burkholderia multivorans]|nr:hypothetical protein IST4119_05201 [Burkholderia multivorans]
MAAQEITRFDVEAEEIGKQRAAAFEEVARIEARIDLMTERVNSLRDLRLTGQASARDDADADRAEADLKVLRETHAAARAAALAIDTPPSMVAHAKDALANLARVEKSIRENQLRQRIAAAEDAYLHAVAALFAERGARTNAQAGYLPSAAMEKYTRLGMLDIR